MGALSWINRGRGNDRRRGCNYGAPYRVFWRGGKWTRWLYDHKYRNDAIDMAKRESLEYFRNWAGRSGFMWVAPVGRLVELSAGIEYWADGMAG